MLTEKMMAAVFQMKELSVTVNAGKVEDEPVSQAKSVDMMKQLVTFYLLILNIFIGFVDQLMMGKEIKM